MTTSTANLRAAGSPGAFPSAHDPALERNEITREELLVHILAEHRHWKKLAARFRRAQRTSASDPARMWRAAHEIGLLAENAYRAERGQSAVTAATSHLMDGATGVNVVEYQLSDGTVSCVLTVEHGRIQRIVSPFRKPSASEVARR